MFFRVGYGLTTGIDIRYDQEDGGDETEEEFDLAEWRTWYSHLNRAPGGGEAPIDVEKLLDVLQWLAERLSGHVVHHPAGPGGMAMSLILPGAKGDGRVDLEAIREEVRDALVPLGVTDLDRAFIGAGNLERRITDKKGHVNEVKLDFIIPAEGWTLDRTGALYEGIPGKPITRERELAAREEAAAKVRETRKDEILAELERRAAQRDAAHATEQARAEADAERSAREAAEQELAQARAEAEAERAAREAAEREARELAERELADAERQRRAAIDQELAELRAAAQHERARREAAEQELAQARAEAEAERTAREAAERQLADIRVAAEAEREQRELRRIARLGALRSTETAPHRPSGKKASAKIGDILDKARRAAAPAPTAKRSKK